MNSDNITMKAVVYAEPNLVRYHDDYHLTQKPFADDVLVEIKSAGICGSDMHAFHGHDDRRKPGLILGHEFCGEIIDGEGTGMMVTGNPLITCGVCDFCRQGFDNLCSDRDMIGMNRQGAFAQYMMIPKRCLVEVPKEMNPSHAALTEPAATAIHAVNLAIEASPRPLPEDETLIVGGGAIGLLVGLLLQSYGVSVCIAETNPLRLKDIKANTQLDTINPVDQDIPSNHFACVLDCVGNAKTRQSAFESIKPNGVIIHVGLQDHDSHIDMRKLTLQQIRLIGSYTYTMKDFTFALKALNKGVFGHLSWIKEMSLSDAQKAFTMLDKGEISSAKIVLKPN